MPGENNQYVVARQVLLDALDALQSHLGAITLVGAQAIYVHLGESSDIALPLLTTDADLALNPAVLGPEPELVQAMQAAGFVRQPDPGIWASKSSGVTVDLLVPEAQGGAGRRAARLSGHGKNAAHKVQGLDAAMVDREMKVVDALEPDDKRSFSVSVAGPTALTIAKLYKLWERKGISTREDAKDALDLWRLLRKFPTAQLAERFLMLLDTKATEAEATQARVYLAELFREETAYGVQQLSQAVRALPERDAIVMSSIFLAQDLIAAIT